MTRRLWLAGAACVVLCAQQPQFRLRGVQTARTERTSHAGVDDVKGFLRTSGGEKRAAQAARVSDAAFHDCIADLPPRPLLRHLPPRPLRSPAPPMLLPT